MWNAPSFLITWSPFLSQRTQKVWQSSVCCVLPKVHKIGMYELSVQFSHSVVSDFVTPWAAACQASLSITNSWSLLRLMSIDLVMPSNHLILCRPFLLPSVFPSIRVFSSESTNFQTLSILSTDLNVVSILYKKCQLM